MVLEFGGGSGEIRRGARMKIIHNIALRLDENESLAFDRAVKLSGLKARDIRAMHIAKRSVDARKKNDIKLVYSVRIEEKSDKPIVREFPQIKSAQRPVVVGFGPAGMFCALRLARHGLKPLVLERGSDVQTRARKTAAYWAGGALDPECNVQFGEGGAGTFSDGKLTTLIGDPLCEEVLADFAAFGAPREILWEAKPHIGTDNLPRVVRNLREEILRLGGEIRFDTRAEDFEIAGGALVALRANGERIEVSELVLAVGHSARDTYRTLLAKGVAAQAKAFSAGVRIEHLAENINRAQYGEAWRHPKLGAADYKLSFRNESGDSAYTFCMCPGGSVVASSSEPDGIVTNGMSEFARDGINSNSALLVGVSFATPEEGIEFQRKLERGAFLLGEGRAPCQRVGDFLAERNSAEFGEVRPTYLPGVALRDLNGLLGTRISGVLREAIPALDRKLRGFAHPDSLLTAPETRSSSPLRFVRGENGESLNVAGLFPCGEGCGYAGGIMSAAVDGLRAADAVIRKIRSKT